MMPSGGLLSSWDMIRGTVGVYGKCKIELCMNSEFGV